MAEGIVVVNDQLTVLLESGAKKYKEGSLGPVDCLIHISLLDI